MTKILASSILALSLATAAAAQGPPGLEKKVPAVQSSITVTIGSSLHCTTEEGTGAFSVTSYSFGAENTGSTSAGGGGGAGKATVMPLSVMKKFDECSPLLFGGVVTGEHFPAVELLQQDEKHH
ncbi:MAG TPA: type VI secretion system tube protein Hcp, partial [Vicinamibacterales bacterium]|nr:type VI secretion system tube protein Hcp [Vicinamibacterales bacterium]